MRPGAGIEKAYNEKGIIILTDPDYSGEEIRQKLTAISERQRAFTKNHAIRTMISELKMRHQRPLGDALTKVHGITKSAKQDNIIHGRS